MHIADYLRSLPERATRHILRIKTGSKDCILKLSWMQADLFDTQRSRNFIKESYVRVGCEENPTVEWILFILLPVIYAEDAIEIVEIYKQRWIIEEYHKCLKSGCKIEEAQLKTLDCSVFWG